MFDGPLFLNTKIQNKDGCSKILMHENISNMTRYRKVERKIW